MITYENAKFHPRFLCQLRGSVMPFSVLVAMPCAMLAVGIKLGATYYSGGEVLDFLGLEKGGDQVASAAFSGMNFLIGFLVVFRAQQAYSRFWEGCTAINNMQGMFFDATSSLVAFCKRSKARAKDIVTFQHTLIRIVSLLNASILMELSENTQIREERGEVAETTVVSRISRRAFELELIDAEGLDSQSLLSINSTCQKAELLFQWIQQLIVESHSKRVFSVEAPILSRAFQELAEGMVSYRQALKIVNIPLPFPYVQATELLLVSHWLLSPFLMCIWTVSPVWTGALTFVQVAFFWSLNSIAAELENPFGEDANDLSAEKMQRDFNKQLLLLMRPSTGRTARLSQKAALAETHALEDPNLTAFGKVCSLKHGEVSISDVPRWRRRSSLERLMGASACSLGHLQTTITGIQENGTHTDSEEEEQASIEEAPMEARRSKPNRCEQDGQPEAQQPSGRRAQAKAGEVPIGPLGPLSSEPKHQPPEMLRFCEEMRERLSTLQPEMVQLHLACLPEILEVGKDLREQARFFSSHAWSRSGEAQPGGDADPLSRRVDEKHRSSPHGVPQSPRLERLSGKEMDTCATLRNWMSPHESSWSQRTRR